MLTPLECRVLGVLVEKAQTTPGQYPLTLNGLVVGCNQKNNRDPVVTVDEDEVVTALDGLRAKSLVRELSMEGSRVPKYRHVARDVLQIDTSSLVILAELLLRGPQTVGELRGRALRMHPLESLEVVEGVLATLAAREAPLVRELPPLPGSRAPRWMQLLCPNLHPLQQESHHQSHHQSHDGSTHESGASARVTASAGSGSGAGSTSGSGVGGFAPADPALLERVAALEASLESLRAEIAALRSGAAS